MSVRVSLSDLTDEQKTIIRKHLYLQPKKTNFTQNRFSDVEKDPVLFYWIDKARNEIVLPYTFANTLFNSHINSTLSYPGGEFHFTGKLRDSQIPVAEKALEQLYSVGTTLLSLPTGFGKSILSIYLASVVKGLVLILTPRETIQKGWVSTIEDNTTAGIWLIDSKMKIPKQCNIIVTMDGKFQKIPWEIRRMVSVLIIDEAHMFCTPTQVPVLLGTTPKFIIACTATLERPDEMHRMIQHIVGLDKIVIKNEKRFRVYKLNTGIKTEFVLNKQGTTDFSKLTASLSMNPIRNAFIVDLIEKNFDSKIMLLSWSKAHIKLLYDVLKKRGESVDYLTGTKSKYHDSRVLLGTISKVATGFDSKNVAINFDGMDINMLISVGSTKSFILHLQSIGRAFRSEFPVIVDFVDDNRISKRHWSARKKNYEEMNCEIIEMHMKKKEKEEPSIEDIHKSRIEAFHKKNKEKKN